MALGDVLKEKRELRRMPLVEAARRAKISAAYLSKLENSDVQQPSPNILYRLSPVLGVDYADLMSLAGYMVPGPGVSDAVRHNAALFGDVSDDERDALLQYLDWYRSRRERTPERG